MPSVLVFAEQRNGKLKKFAAECLSEGRRLADKTNRSLAAVLIGDAIAPLAAEIGRFGSDLTLTVSDPRLALYAPSAYARAAHAAAVEAGADVVILPASAMGKDLASRLAVKLDSGVASDCTAVVADGTGLKAVRPVYSGKAYATAAFTEGHPVVLTLRPNVFPLLDGARAGKGEARALAVPFDERDFASRAIQVKLPETAEVDVAEADIVVSGGRAMKGPENFSYIRSLAEALGGSVGASRAAVDAGWIDHRYQVGQTGKVVAPKLYVACGISGAIQHLAGMSSSKVIVAINKDSEAPIFKIADYGLVGDLYALIPLLVEEVKKLKSS
jgi:electron transfer flavoprotein alpha subunit